MGRWPDRLQIKNLNPQTLLAKMHVHGNEPMTFFCDSLKPHTLKNQGYHLEHNYGLAKKHLSAVFVTIMMLAFLVDQVQQLCCPLFRAVRAKLHSKRDLWERVRALFFDFELESMRMLYEALLYGYKRPVPEITFDSS